MMIKNDVDATPEQHNLEDHCSGSLKLHQNIFFRPNKNRRQDSGYPRHQNNPRQRPYALAPARSQTAKKTCRERPLTFFFWWLNFAPPSVFGIHFLISEVLMGVVYNISVYIYRFVY